jgi:hypothetical protein
MSVYSGRPEVTGAPQNDAIDQSGTERHCLYEESFNGDGAVVRYLNTVRTTKEPDVVQIVNDTQGADDMSDQDEWISYSHWGMLHWNENPRTSGLRDHARNIAGWIVVNPHAE